MYFCNDNNINLFDLKYVASMTRDAVIFESIKWIHLIIWNVKSNLKKTFGWCFKKI